jgi:hypothetical protein
MLCVFISSDVATEIVKPQYRHVIIRSSWLGLNGAPHLVQLVGISFLGGGILTCVAVGSMVGMAAGMGVGMAAGI